MWRKAGKFLQLAFGISLTHISLRRDWYGSHFCSLVLPSQLDTFVSHRIAMSFLAISATVGRVKRPMDESYLLASSGISERRGPTGHLDDLGRAALSDIYTIPNTKYVQFDSAHFNKYVC